MARPPRPAPIRISAAHGLMRGALAALALALALASAPTPALAATPAARISLDATTTLLLTASGGRLAALGTIWAPARLGMTQRTYRFAVKRGATRNGTLAVTVRRLPSGSAMVFVRLDGSGRAISVDVAVSTSATSATTVDLHNTADLTYSTVLGVDKTSGPLGWTTLRLANGVASVFASKSYRFTTMTKRYGPGRVSSIRRLVAETANASVKRAGGLVRPTYGLSAKGDSCERYLLIAPRGIEDTATSAYSVKTVTRSESRWLDVSGAYEKAPYSIEPATRIGYNRSLLFMREATTLAAFKATGSSLFADLLANDLYSLSLIRSGDGLWRTDYTSTWVKKESGITAPYVDTRHNEQLALQSAACARALEAAGVVGVDAAEAWEAPYAAFLAERAQTGAVARTAHGFFFADYYGPSGKLLSHSSLNHQLGTMNYLLKFSAITSSTAPMTLAAKIRSAVDDTGARWIAPNFDLYYQRNLTGTFSGTDYRTVTYYDLVESQQLLHATFGAYDATLSQLLAAKSRFLGVANGDPALGP